MNYSYLTLALPEMFISEAWKKHNKKPLKIMVMIDDDGAFMVSATFVAHRHIMWTQTVHDWIEQQCSKVAPSSNMDNYYTHHSHTTIPLS